MKRSYYAPASVGNVSVGFDVLGLALAPEKDRLLGDVLTVATAPHTSLAVDGRYRHQLPEAQDDNLVLQCWQAFRERVPNALPELAFTLNKNLPVGSGLGSSACSIVVTCYALNDFFGQPLETERLLKLMGQLEGAMSGAMHYDNVAPSYFGGLQLLLPHSNTINVALPWLATWRVVVSYPGTVIRTADARRVLPKQVPMTTASEAAAQLAGFVSALYQGDEALALDCLTDVLAEPHRQSLIPMLQPLRAQAQQLGIQHLGISGAGPTLFAICSSDEQAQAMYDLFVAHYHHTADAMTHICRIDTQGARCLDSQDNHDEVS